MERRQPRFPYLTSLTFLPGSGYRWLDLKNSRRHSAFLQATCGGGTPRVFFCHEATRGKRMKKRKNNIKIKEKKKRRKEGKRDRLVFRGCSRRENLLCIFHGGEKSFIGHRRFVEKTSTNRIYRNRKMFRGVTKRKWTGFI